MQTHSRKPRLKTIRLLAERLLSLGAHQGDAEALAVNIGLARSTIYELTRGCNQGRVNNSVLYLRKLVSLALRGKLKPSRDGHPRRLVNLTRQQFDEVLEAPDLMEGELSSGAPASYWCLLRHHSHQNW